MRDRYAMDDPDRQTDGSFLDLVAAMGNNDQYLIINYQFDPKDLKILSSVFLLKVFVRILAEVDFLSLTLISATKRKESRGNKLKKKDVWKKGKKKDDFIFARLFLPFILISIQRGSQHEF